MIQIEALLDLVVQEYNMGFLKLKAKIYQYTGIFLAQKEVNLYINSQDFKDEVRRMTSYDDGGPTFSIEECQNLLIGSWEAHYGFYRRFSTTRGILDWLRNFYLQLRDDLTGN